MLNVKDTDKHQTVNAHFIKGSEKRRRSKGVIFLCTTLRIYDIILVRTQ